MPVSRSLFADAPVNALDAPAARPSLRLIAAWRDGAAAAAAAAAHGSVAALLPPDLRAAVVAEARARGSGLSVVEFSSEAALAAAQAALRAQTALGSSGNSSSNSSSSASSGPLAYVLRDFPLVGDFGLAGGRAPVGPMELFDRVWGKDGAALEHRRRRRRQLLSRQAAPADSNAAHDAAAADGAPWGAGNSSSRPDWMPEFERPPSPSPAGAKSSGSGGSGGPAAAGGVDQHLFNSGWGQSPHVDALAGRPQPPQPQSRPQPSQRPRRLSDGGSSVSGGKGANLTALGDRGGGGGSAAEQQHLYNAGWLLAPGANAKAPARARDQRARWPAGGKAPLIGQLEALLARARAARAKAAPALQAAGNATAGHLAATPPLDQHMYNAGWTLAPHAEAAHGQPQRAATPARLQKLLRPRAPAGGRQLLQAAEGNGTNANGTTANGATANGTAAAAAPARPAPIDLPPHLAAGGLDAAKAWALAEAVPAVVVAVVGSGVEAAHPRLGAGAAWANGAEVAGDGIDNDGNGAGGSCGERVARVVWGGHHD